MDVLDKLLGSGARVKVMRFFLKNPEEVFLLPDISKTLRLTKGKVRKEINFLKGIGFLGKGVREVQLMFSAKGRLASGRKTKKRSRKKKEAGFRLNSFFPFTRQFHSLLAETSDVSRELLQKRFRRLGKGLRLVLLSGIFVGRPAAEAIDILVVGDNLRRGPVEKILGKIEAELGKELNYALFSTVELKYRMGMYDKFIRDILESEHDKIIDTLGT